LPAIGLLSKAAQQVHSLLSEEVDVSPEMASRIDELCGNGPEIFIRMQEPLHLWKAKVKNSGRG
jgi:plasmid maintenance system antidote protein VapI